MRKLSLRIAFLVLVSVMAVSRVGYSYPGLGVLKDCPITPVAPGCVFTCTFAITNEDSVNSVTSLSVTNTVPCPDPPTCTGGTTTAVPCLQNGLPVTTLGPLGSATDTCTGSVDETAPACTASDMLFSDKIEASGFDGTSPVLGAAVNFVTIPACTKLRQGIHPCTPTPTRIRFLVEGPIRVAPGVPVEFSFQVEALGEEPIAPIGEVVVSDRAGHTCRADVSTTGEGACQLTFGNPGTFVVRAEYLGNATFRSSTSAALPVLVTPAGAAAKAATHAARLAEGK